ncbi:MAG TPA: TIGR01777 family oxidoreductase [Bacteroidales bacterium]|nr:TIGR01777 family oxidoreductase [Bacteroidales bacterium]
MPENQSHQTTEDGPLVLITGGRGLIGRYLTSRLLSEGYQVSHLSRQSNQFGKVRVYRWDPDNGILDPVVFDGVDYIIHLAGANLGEKRWTEARKAEIKSSRIESSKLIHNVLTENKIPVKAFISASAVGYYGAVTTDRVFNEEDPPANDFTGSVCRLWEESADMFSKSGIRTVKIRTAMVLEKYDSGLSRILKPAGYGLFPILGSGKQYMPWIHINDLCNVYIKALKDEKMSGPYNAVSPAFTTHTEFMRDLALTMHKSFFHPPVPAFLLKAAMGEMADIILKGSKVSSGKLTALGFTFKYPGLKEALDNILNGPC